MTDESGEQSPELDTDAGSDCGESAGNNASEAPNSGQSGRRTKGLRTFVAWIPFAVTVTGILLALLNSALTFTDYQLEPLFPYSAARTDHIYPGTFRSSNPHPIETLSTPGIAPATVSVEVVSLDLPARMASTRVSLSLSEEIVQNLRVGKGSERVMESNRASWGDAPVEIQLTTCLTAMPINCGVPVATVPLGKLVGNGGALPQGATVSTSITLPISGSPERYPSDAYYLSVNSPQVTLASNVSLYAKKYKSAFGEARLPTAVNLGIGRGLPDQVATFSESGNMHPRVLALTFERPVLEKATIYLMAMLPLVLGVVVSHISLRRHLASFDLGNAAGLIALILTILPLRSVLMPSDLASIGLTLVDYILIIGVLVMTAMLFVQYAMATTRALRDENLRLADATPPRGA
ncbi:hypothetical protein [Streptomyces sp. NPDC003278]|uniref:hypothetical protein n=1 Tax=Streptomyces sp. NPDC003278 TaxID=3364679 RepID=UPI0036B338A2